jgi:hypothetical protein
LNEASRTILIQGVFFVPSPERPFHPVVGHGQWRTVSVYDPALSFEHPQSQGL